MVLNLFWETNDDVLWIVLDLKIWHEVKDLYKLCDEYFEKFWKEKVLLWKWLEEFYKIMVNYLYISSTGICICLNTCIYSGKEINDPDI